MECEIYKTVKRTNISDNFIKQIIQCILSHIKAEVHISVHLIGDARMKSLNKQYRGQNKTTDVLSFAMKDGMSMPMGNELGDIFISIPRIRVQAHKHDVSFKEEFVRMLVHGVLHLLQYDHITKKDADNMFGLQEVIVSEIIL